MKIYFTPHEGALWMPLSVTRKQINYALKTFMERALAGNATVGAIRIGKSPIVYDFVLLKLKHQPWIREYEPQDQENFLRFIC